MRLSLILAVAAAAGTFAVSSAKAQTIECDEFYTVQSGDTLQKIADRAYGRGSAYQILYSSNRDAVGRNPGIIQIGAKIWVPCINGGSPKTTASLPDIQGSNSGQATVKLLTGSDFKPFTHEPLENGGLFTELVKRAIETADSDLKYRIDFINDWASHLQPLLSEGVYDMGFPWYKPDCTQYERLGNASKFRCDNLDFSDPFYETVVSYFGLAKDQRELSEPTQLHGMKLCRPSGYFKFDLEVRELVAPNVTLLQPESVNDCFDMLERGEVDIVTMNVLTADAAIKERNLSDKIREYEDLATIETLHVIVPKTHPRGRSLLLRVNRGLKSLQRDNAYRAVVEKHLAAFIN